MLELLADDELHIWQGTSNGRTAYADWALLSSTEHQRWWRLAPATAARFAAAHAARRRIAARYLDAPPAMVRFGPPGAVVCDQGAPLSVSLSEAGDHWLLAVGRRPVGADIRDVGPVDGNALPEVALSEAEREALAEADEPELFYRCWTRKEALIKAAGLRGYADLRQVDVAPEREDGTVVEWPESRTRWLVRSLPAADGTCAAVAMPADETASLVMRSWPDRIECQAA